MPICWEGIPGGPALGSADGVLLCVSNFPLGTADEPQEQQPSVGPGASAERGGGDGDRAAWCPLQVAPALAGPPPTFLLSEKNAHPSWFKPQGSGSVLSHRVILQDTEKERQGLRCEPSCLRGVAPVNKE